MEPEPGKGDSSLDSERRNELRPLARVAGPDPPQASQAGHIWLARRLWRVD